MCLITDLVVTLPLTDSLKYTIQTIINIHCVYDNNPDIQTTATP